VVRAAASRKLPSDALRATVYAGTDPVSERRHYLREVVPAGLRAYDKGEKVRARLLSQVDERRQPKTRATEDQLLDRRFGHAELERTTLSTYVGYAKNGNCGSCDQICDQDGVTQADRARHW
jgi:integrase